MPRMSLRALEILGRQTRVDPLLDDFPEVRENLLTMIRSYQRMGLDQGGQDIAVGRVLNRRHLLLLVPSGRLKSPDAMNLVVRIEEQNAKGNSALRRAERRGALWVKEKKAARRPLWESRHERGAGAEPTEVEGGEAEGGSR